MVSTVMNESLRTALECADCVATVVLRKQLNFKSGVIRSTIFLVEKGAVRFKQVQRVI